MTACRAHRPATRPSPLAAILAAILVSALVAVLGGCSGAPAPAVQAPVAGAPALVPGQVHRVVTQVAHALSSGDRTHDTGALTPRVDGASLALRTAAYAVHAHVATAPAPTPLGGSLLLEAVPTAGGWPRWFLAVTRASKDAVPQLLILTQASPRAQYHLSASATLLPGTTLATPARSSGGSSESLRAGASSGLALSPADALTRYADVLTSGSASRWATSTATDPFRTQVGAEQEAERSGVAAYDSYTATHTPRAGALWALRTTTGSGLVIGVLDSVRTFTPKGAGVDQPLTPDLAALAGRPDAPSGLSVNTTEVVVLSVPAAGSGAQTSLVAAARGTTGVVLH